MFDAVGAQLIAIAMGLAKIAGAGALLAVICLALMNMWAIFDPRMGQGIKGNLIRVALSLALIAGAAGAGAAGMTLA